MEGFQKSKRCPEPGHTGYPGKCAECIESRNVAFWDRITRLMREFAHNSEGQARRRFVGRPEFGFRV